ncbi:MAG: hypothetical protein ACI9UN_004382 [Granulosicoccus sp.]|jgi:hypothetical protein
MNKQLLGCTALLLTSSVAVAAPPVNGNTIGWPDDGWYQVQDEETHTEACGGGRSCVVEPGSYVVINHSTGERFRGIDVVDEGSPSINPPSVPTDLRCLVYSSAAIELEWNAATDDDGTVVEYQVHRDGSLIATQSTLHFF